MQFCLNLFLGCFLPQENVKTKHPQLLYESKLYKILQGGGKAPGTGLGTALLLTGAPAAAAAQAGHSSVPIT